MKGSDSSQIDISELPQLANGWTWCVPSDICSVVASGSTPTSDKMFEGSGDVPFIKVYNLTHRGILNFSLRPTFIATDTHSVRLKRSITRPGDVLINIVGPPLGKVSLVPDDFPEWNINQAIVLFRPHDEILSRYLAYAFLTDAVMIRVTRLAKATAGQFNIGVGMCRHLLPVPLAPLNEQHRIVAKIDESFSDLDAGVAALARAKANLKRYRASVLKAAVEGRLTEAWRAQHQPAETGGQLLQRILKQRRRKWEEDQLAAFAAAGKQPPNNWRVRYKEPVAPDTTRAPELPDGWCWATLDQLLVYLRNGYFQSPTGSDRGIPILRINSVRPMRVDLAEVKYLEGVGANVGDYYIDNGDLLFTRYNGSVELLGVAGMVRGCTQKVLHPDKLIRVKLAIGQPLPSFIEISANVGLSRQHMAGRARTTAGQTGISGEDTREMPIPLPPLAEQSQIVADIIERLSQIDAAEVEISRGLVRAARLRQSILKRAFEGKLVAQDPADEPAAALLARIQQSRASNALVQTKGKQPSDEFLRRAAIVSYTVKRLAPQPSFGRTQLEKTLHLAQSHLGIDLGLEFERYAAGPFDKSIYRLEATAKKSGWFSKQDRRRFGVTYHPGPKIDAMCQHAARLLGDKQADFDRLLDQIAAMNTDEAELFATAYAAWNDLLIDRRPAGDNSIIAEIHAWHESKRRFSPAVIRARLKWMRQNGYVPAGSGQRTRLMSKSAGDSGARRGGRRK